VLSAKRGVGRHNLHAQATSVSQGRSSPRWYRKIESLRGAFFVDRHLIELFRLRFEGERSSSPIMGEAVGYYAYLEDILREHVADERVRAEGLHCLIEMRRDRAGLVMGCISTLKSILADELPREGRQKPDVCILPDESLAELVRWEGRIRRERNRLSESSQS
jgi:hypothetical protein